MTSMIERLTGDPALRPDERRILPVRRPLPERPRELLEIFTAMGGEASKVGMLRSLDLRGGTQCLITFIALNRWPTMAELQAHAGNYNPAEHLAFLVECPEFRRFLAQRILSAYPEKKRLLYVRIPRCAGSHFLTMANTMHPVFSDHITRARPVPRFEYYRTLGLLLGKFESTRTVMLIQSRLWPFYQPAPPVAAEAAPASAEDVLPWTMNIPPYRSGDRLFTVVRDPEDIILSEVNAVAEALRSGDSDNTPQIRRWRQRLGELPDAGDAARWPDVARRVLARFPDADPICHALGDGTTESALEACLVTDIEIAHYSRYSEWILRTWDTKPEPPEPRPPAILPREALTAAELGRLAALTTQDRPLYDRIAALAAASPLASIKGLQLMTAPP